MLMELLYRFCKTTQPEIGRLLGGIDYSAVSQARKRLHIKIQNAPEWEEKFNQIQGKLSQMSRIKIYFTHFTFHFLILQNTTRRMVMD